MKYCWRNLPFCLIWIILFGSISLFGQVDPAPKWDPNPNVLDKPVFSPPSVRRKVTVSPVALPENLLPYLVITDAETREFQRFLSEKETGIFKLWNDICGEIKVIDVSKNADCLEYSDYALASQYSLDLQKYFNLNAHILLSKNHLLAPQNLNQSFQLLMDLGVRELSGINRKTKEVKELSNVKMIDRYGEFQMNKVSESANIKSNRISFSYRADRHHVFLLRSVFGETADWQRETIYAFQLVKFENNIATIIWKKIISKWA